MNRATEHAGLSRLPSLLVPLLLAVLSWPAVSQLFAPGYLDSYDGILHLARFADFDRVIRSGLIYPRWLPDLSQGHGLPLLNYYAPLAYYLAEIPRLAGLGLASAVQLSLAVSVVISGWGMYAFARRLKSAPLAAVAAASAYMYLPFHLDDIYSRGGIAEVWAVAFLPWLATGLVWFAEEPSAISLCASGAFGAAEIMSHNVTALFAFPVVGLWALLAPPLKLNKRKVALVLLAAAAGLIASASYWLPSVGELRLAHTSVFLTGGVSGTFDLPDLVQRRFFAVYGDQSYRLVLPEAMTLLALVAAAGVLVITRRKWRRENGLAALGATLTLGLIGAGLTNASIPVWNAIPLADFIQFPWRLLLFVGFTLCALMALLGSASRRFGPPLLLLPALLAASSLGHLPPARFDVGPNEINAGRLAAFEYGRAADGGLFDEQFVPAAASLEVLKGAQGKLPPPKATALPPLSIQLVNHSPDGWTIRTTATTASFLRLQQYFFPGWRVRIDGQAVKARPATPAGLLEVSVPQGSHVVQFDYAGTGLEQAATFVSVAAVVLLFLLLALAHPWTAAPAIALLGAAGYLHWHAPPNITQPVNWQTTSEQLVGLQPPHTDGRNVDTSLVWMDSAPRQPRNGLEFVLATPAGAEVQRWPEAQVDNLPSQYLAPNELFTRTYTLPLGPGVAPGSYELQLSDGSSSVPLGQVEVAAAAPASHPLNLPFGDLAELASYQLRTLPSSPLQPWRSLSGRADATLHPGDTLEASFQWLPRARTTTNYVGFVHLIDSAGHTLASQDNQPDATMRATSSWVPGVTVSDNYLLRVDAHAPPGLYRLEVGLYHLTSDFQFVKVNGTGNSALFGSVKVRPLRPPPPPASDAPAWQEPISLVSWQQARRGRDLALTFNWAATGNVSLPYTLFVQLLDSSGRPAFQADGPPQDGLFPTDLWENGDRIRDTHVVRQPKPGRYRLAIGWYDPATGRRVPLKDGGDSLYLGEIAI